MFSAEGFSWAGEGEQLRIVLELAGKPSAYALYRIKPSFEESGASTGIVQVLEAMGDSPEATASVWRYLLDIDWLEHVRASLLPVYPPLFLLLAEPRRMGFRVGDALWLRLVDVGAALRTLLRRRRHGRARGPGHRLLLERWPLEAQ